MVEVLINSDHQQAAAALVAAVLLTLLLVELEVQVIPQAPLLLREIAVVMVQPMMRPLGQPVVAVVRVVIAQTTHLVRLSLHLNNRVVVRWLRPLLRFRLQRNIRLQSVLAGVVAQVQLLGIKDQMVHPQYFQQLHRLAAGEALMVFPPMLVGLH